MVTARTGPPDLAGLGGLRQVSLDTEQEDRAGRDVADYCRARTAASPAITAALARRVGQADQSVVDKFNRWDQLKKFVQNIVNIVLLQVPDWEGTGLLLVCQAGPGPD